MGAIVGHSSGVVRRRTGLATLELGWYVALLVVVIGGWSPVRPVRAVEYWVVVGVGAACMVAAAARWRRPHWTTPLALTMLAFAVLVLLMRPIEVLGPLRLMLSAAVGPVLVAAVTRGGSRVAAMTAVVLAGSCASLDAWHTGDSVSTDFARSLMRGEPTPQLILVTSLLFVLIPVAVGLLLRSADATQRAERLARLRAEERLQVARELHDTVANHVTGMLINAQAAETSTEESTRQRCVEIIEDTGQQALTEMKRMVGALRAPAGQGTVTDPAEIREELPAWMNDPADAVRAAVGDDDRVRLRVVEPPGEETGAPGTRDGHDATPAVLVTLHRITREAVTNARRYTSAGSTIDVELSAARASTLRLRIDSDLSRRAALVRGGGYGLLGLHERAAAVGGHLEAGPDGSGRWSVRAELPR